MESDLAKHFQNIWDAIERRAESGFEIQEPYYIVASENELYFMIFNRLPWIIRIKTRLMLTLWLTDL